MKLWLDDIREPWKFGCVGWEWAKTAEQAVALLKTGNVEIASLDHDLTTEQMMGGMIGIIREDNVKSGYDVVLWLEQNPQYWPPKGTFVHSMNPVGRERMAWVIAQHYDCSPMQVQRFLGVNV